jgi:hypothetical protein
MNRGFDDNNSDAQLEDVSSLLISLLIWSTSQNTGWNHQQGKKAMDQKRGRR